MDADIIKIGNSKGIRIPASNSIILKPIKSPRAGWAAAFKAMAKRGDDQILITDELDSDMLEE